MSRREFEAVFATFLGSVDAASLMDSQRQVLLERVEEALDRYVLGPV